MEKRGDFKLIVEFVLVVTLILIVVAIITTVVARGKEQGTASQECKGMVKTLGGKSGGCFDACDKQTPEPGFKYITAPLKLGCTQRCCIMIPEEQQGSAQAVAAVASDAGGQSCQTMPAGTWGYGVKQDGNNVVLPCMTVPATIILQSGHSLYFYYKPLPSDTECSISYPNGAAGQYDNKADQCFQDAAKTGGIVRFSPGTADAMRNYRYGDIKPSSFDGGRGTFHLKVQGSNTQDNTITVVIS